MSVEQECSVCGWLVPVDRGVDATGCVRCARAAATERAWREGLQQARNQLVSR
jgi:hypothetical protein